MRTINGSALSSMTIAILAVFSTTASSADIIKSDSLFNTIQKAENQTIRYTAESITIENSDSTEAVYASTAGKMYVGGADTKTVRIVNSNPEGYDAVTAIADGATGNFVEIRASDSVVIESATVGIWGQSNTEQTTRPENSSRVSIHSRSVSIHSKDTAIAAYSNSKVDIEGEQIVLASDNNQLIETRGNAVVNINSTGQAKSVKLNGDIIFGTPGSNDNSGAIINANVTINLEGTDSYWSGTVSKYYPDASIGHPEYIDITNGVTLGLADGAQWTPNNVVASTEEQSKGDKHWTQYNEPEALSALTLNQGIINIKEADQQVSVKSLSGTGGTINVAGEMTDGTLVTGTFKADAVSSDNPSFDVNLTGVNSDGIDNAQAALSSLADAVNVAGSEKNLTIAEGDINGAISQTVDKDGNQSEIKQGVNQKLDGYSSIAALSAVQWRHENDTLLKRMGELRDSEGAVGAWARIYGSEQEYGAQSVTAKNTTVQAGADYDVGSGWKVGGAFSYTNGNSSFDLGESDAEMYGFSVYGTYLAENGLFVDVIGKYSRLSNEFTSGTMKGEFDNNAFSVAVETGWHHALNNLAFVEPSAGVTYGRIMGDDFMAHNGVKVEQDDYDSLIGRLGVRSGFYFPNQKGSVYARAAVLHDFMGDMESTASKDGNVAHLKDELGDTWVEYGIGANFNLSKNAYTFVDLEKTAGGDVKEAWKWTIGARLAF